MRTLRWSLLLLLASIPSWTSIKDPLAVHHRILQLQERYYEHLASNDRRGASTILNEMARLDPQHPLIGRLAVYLHYERESWDEAESWLRSEMTAGPGLSLGLGTLAQFRGDGDEAEARAREALERYSELGHLPGQAHSRLLLGAALQDSSRRRDEAAGEFEAARTLFQRLEDRLGEARTIGLLGGIERARKNEEAALARMREAQAIRRELGDLRGQARSWYSLGLTYKTFGRREEADAALRNALELYRQLNDRVGQYGALHQLALIHTALGNQDEVGRYYAEAVELAAIMGSERRLADARYELGKSRLLHGQTDEAIEVLRLAVAAEQALGQATASHAYRILGLGLRHVGELSAAEEALHSAVKRAEQVDSLRTRRATLADALTTLATISHSKGELAQALLYLERALDLWRQEPPSKRAESKVLNDLGLVNWHLGRLESARRQLEQALALAQEIEDRRMLARSHNSLGMFLAGAGQTDRALAHLTTAIELRTALDERKLVAITRYSLADLLWSLRRRDEARRMLEVASDTFREFEDLESESLALSLTARFLLDEGRLDAALPLFSRAIDLSREHGFRWPLFVALDGRASLHEAAGNDVPAAKDLAETLNVVESLRASQTTDELKMRFFAGKAALYERAVAIEARVEGGQASRAFQIAERARARSLLDLLTESRQTSGVALREELAGRETKLVDAVSSAAVRLTWAADDAARRLARQALDAAEERLRSFQTEIRRQAPHYSDIVYTEPITLRRVQTAMLRQDETLLRYFVGDEQAMLWVVDRERASYRRLPHPDQIARLVGEFRDEAGRATVSLGDGVAGADLGRKLAEALGLSNLPAGHRLLVVPDGPLLHLPFDALRINGRYLIEDHEIVAMPSATTLDLMRREPGSVADGGFLGIGDPLGGGEDARFAPLHHSGLALDRIAEMFPDDRRVVLKGARATKSSLREQPLERYRYLPFATHGWLDAERPRYFGLQLSPSREGAQDGFLYLDEIFPMKLQAELVVLAACRSAMGEMLDGEGLVGMSRGFLYAGARSLLVSLWDIEDRASAEFMEAFYRELVRGRSVPQALRTVKLSYIRSERRAQRQPYRWAPFVLVGDAPQGSTTSNSKTRAGSASPDA